MKSHKFWGIMACIGMFMTMESGFNMTSKGKHKFWGLITAACMVMAMWSGFKMAPGKPKKTAEPLEDVTEILEIPEEE